MTYARMCFMLQVFQYVCNIYRQAFSILNLSILYNTAEAARVGPFISRQTLGTSFSGCM